MVTDTSASNPRYAIPSVQCTATSRSSGKRCRRYATPGTTTCRRHGSAAKQVKEKARRTNVISITQAASALRLPDLLDGPRTTPWVALLNAGHVLGAIVQDLEAQVRDGGSPVTPELVDRLTAASKASASIAKLALDAGISKLLVEAQELEVQSMRRVLTAGLDQVELDPEVRAAIVLGFQVELMRVEHERLPSPEGTEHLHEAEERLREAQERLRTSDRERARPFALDASSDSALDEPSVAPAPPFSGPGPVMGRPGIPHVPAVHARTGMSTEPVSSDTFTEPVWLPAPDLGGRGHVAEPVLVGVLLDGDDDDKYRHEPRWW